MEVVNRQFNILIASIILVICFTSAFITKFDTILIPGFLIAIYLICKDGNYKYIRLKQFFEPLIWVVFIVILYDLKFISGHGFDIMATGDKNFYAQVSAFIRHAGVESYYFDYTLNAQAEPIPYHYGENWITIIFSGIFKMNEFFSQELIAVPAMIGLAMYAIFKTNLVLNNGKVAVAFLFTLIVTFYIGWPFIELKNIPKVGEMIDEFQIPINHMPKYAFSFMCTAILCYSIALNGMKVSALTVLFALFAFLCCLSFLPVLGILLLVYLFTSAKRDWLVVSISVLSLLFFYFFYFVLHKSQGASNFSAFNFSLFSDCYSYGYYFKTMMNIVLKSIIQTGIIYLPFILLVVFLFFWKRNRRLQLYPEYHLGFIVVILIGLSGLLFWGGLWHSMGSISLYVDGGYSFFKLGFLFLSLTIIYKAVSASKVSTCVLFVAGLLLVVKPIMAFVLVNEQAIDPEKMRVNSSTLIQPEKPLVYLRQYNTDGGIYKKNLLAEPSFASISNVNCNQEGVFVNINQINRATDCLYNYRENALIWTSCYCKYMQKNPLLSDSVLINNFVNENKIDLILSDEELSKKNEGVLGFLNYKLESRYSNVFAYQIIH